MSWRSSPCPTAAGRCRQAHNRVQPAHDLTRTSLLRSEGARALPAASPGRAGRTTTRPCRCETRRSGRGRRGHASMWAVWAKRDGEANRGVDGVHPPGDTPRPRATLTHAERYRGCCSLLVRVPPSAPTDLRKRSPRWSPSRLGRWRHRSRGRPGSRPGRTPWKRLRHGAHCLAPTQADADQMSPTRAADPCTMADVEFHGAGSVGHVSSAWLRTTAPA